MAVSVLTPPPFRAVCFFAANPPIDAVGSSWGDAISLLTRLPPPLFFVPSYYAMRLVAPQLSCVCAVCNLAVTLADFVLVVHACKISRNSNNVHDHNNDGTDDH